MVTMIIHGRCIIAKGAIPQFYLLCGNKLKIKEKMKESNDKSHKLIARFRANICKSSPTITQRQSSSQHKSRKRIKIIVVGFERCTNVVPVVSANIITIIGKYMH